MERPSRFGEGACAAIARAASPSFIRPDLRELRVMEEESIEPHEALRSSRLSFFGSPKASNEDLKPAIEPRGARVTNGREEREQLEMLLRLHDEMSNAWLPRRLALRVYMAWFSLRRTRRKVVRDMLTVGSWCVEAACAWCLLILVPAQLAFEIVVVFNWAYAVGYALDAILLASRLHRLCLFFSAVGHSALARVDALLYGRLGVIQKLDANRRRSRNDDPRLSAAFYAARASPPNSPSLGPTPQEVPPAIAALDRLSSAVLRGGPPGAIQPKNHRAPPWLAGSRRGAAVVGGIPWDMWQVVKALPVLPYDVCMWGTDAQWAVPYVRVIRALVYWYTTIDRTAADLERSPRIAFTGARAFRVLNFFLLAAHWLGCFFFLACRQQAASHYATSVAHFQLFHARGQDGFVAAADLPLLYLRSLYWGFMTLTTTGHVDIIEDSNGNDWEVLVAVAVILFATLVYIYLNANFTALMLRMTAEIDRYRARIGMVDAYLQRNSVSKQTARMVRKHFRGRVDEEASADKQILQQMPLTLQKRVLQDVYSHTLRHVPLFTFEGADPALVEQICTLLRPAFLLAEENVYKQGELAREMYFLEEGMLLQWEAPDMTEAEELDEVTNLVEASNARARCAMVPVAGGALGAASTPPPGPRRALSGALSFESSENGDGASSADAGELSRTARPESSVPRGANGGASDSRYGSASADIMQRAAGQRKAGPPPAVMLAAAKMREARERAQRQENVVMGAKGSVVGDVAVLFGVRHINSVEAVRPSKLLILDKSDFLTIMHDFPAELEQMRQMTLDRLRRKRHPALAQIEQLQTKTPEVVAKLGDLMFAAAAGDVLKVRAALAAGVSPNERDHNGGTALHVASCAGHQPVVKLLLEAGSIVSVKDHFGASALQCALKRSHAGVIKLLRHAGATLSMSGDEAAMELCSCVMQGRVLQIKLLLMCGAPVDAATYDQRTALHVAAAEGNMSIVQLLVAEGATLSPRDRLQCTPLGYALKRSNYALAHWLHGMGAELGWSDERAASGRLCELARDGLLEKLRNTILCGANVNVADYDMRTPLHLAAAEGRLPCAQLLVDSGADVNAKDRFGATPLREAILFQHLDLARMLCTRGGTLGLDESAVAAELQKVVHKGHMSELRLLLESGADPDSRDLHGRTALHVACAFGRSTAVQALVEAGANVNAVDSFGYTPLQDAVRTDHLDVADALRNEGAELMLGSTAASFQLCSLALEGKASRLALYLRCGANPDSADHDSRTALHVAAAEGNLPCVKVLVAANANPSAVDRWGGTPLQDALRNGHTGELASTLYEAGGQLRTTEDDAANQLCYFASQGLVDRVATLVRLGASVNVANVDRRTPLHVAAAEGHKSTCICLLDAGADLGCLDRWGNTPVDEARRSGLDKLFDLRAYHKNAISQRESAAVQSPARKWIPTSLSLSDKVLTPWRTSTRPAGTGESSATSRRDSTGMAASQSADQLSGRV